MDDIKTDTQLIRYQSVVCTECDAAQDTSEVANCREYSKEPGHIHGNEFIY
jgi:hypothetical protein